MTEHVLKCLSPYFAAIKRGDKNFEVRRDDRGYQRGDTLVLRNYDGRWHLRDIKGGYEEITRTITYVLTGGQFGIEPGYVVLGLGEQAHDGGER